MKLENIRQGKKICSISLENSWMDVVESILFFVKYTPMRETISIPKLEDTVSIKIC